MKNSRTMFVLMAAFMLGAVATALVSGCQKVPSPEGSSAVGAELEEGSGEEATAQVAPPHPVDEPSPAGEPNPADEPNPAGEPSPAGEPNPADGPDPGTVPVAADVEIVTDRTADPPIPSGDWPQLGGTGYRNNVAHGTGIPTDWDVGEFDRGTQEWNPDSARNIKWVARLGSQTYGNPVVASQRVYVGTNNRAGWLPRYPAEIDLGCLLCFSEEDGRFLWQDSSEKLPSGRENDWPLVGICCAPLVEGNRVWFVTSRGEVKCLDAEGFHDDEDDGVQDQWGRMLDIRATDDGGTDPVAAAVEALDQGTFPESLRGRLSVRGADIPADTDVHVQEPGNSWTFQIEGAGGSEFRVKFQERLLSIFKRVTPADKQESDVVWVFDMMSQMPGQQVFQHNMCSCSVTSLGDILFVNTSNGVDESHEHIPSPEAPSFMAMDKNTGEIYWTDRSPGLNILHGQWSSPAVANLGGVPQVIFGGGDGWVYSFLADQGSNGKPTLLWKFDANPKESEWIIGGRGTRNNIIATPVIHDGLVYVAMGQDPEYSEGSGQLWCIDPTKRDDVSPQLAVKLEGDEQHLIPHRRVQAVLPDEGEAAVENPNSAAVWHFSEQDRNGDGQFDFDEAMHRSCGGVAIKDDLLFIADFSGLVHCIHAKTGQVHWAFDMLAAAWGAPLIVNDQVYAIDEDGDVSIFNLSSDPQVAMKEIEGEMYPINAREEEDDTYLVGDVTNMGNSVYTSPVVANDVLYVANRSHLFAIGVNHGK